jgi:processive 1,2-diacylglycerol beta-glucosyltransferase
MKALIMSITAGQGHHSTAAALKESLIAQDIECEVIDTYEYIAPVLKEAVAKGYLMTTAYTPRATGRVYRLAERKGGSGMGMHITKATNSLLSSKVKDFIEEYNADFIICTHVFAAGIVNALLENGVIPRNVVTAGIITDFTIHPFWEDVEMIDYFITASELLGYQLVQRGIPLRKMLPMGIPIHSKFYNKLSKEEARKTLGLDPYKRTVLFMSGSMGFGKIEKAVSDADKLSEDFQALVVCGNNKKVYANITETQFQKNIRCFGYVNNVEVMMDASDCIVTKPGGITISEAMAKSLPMILINPIPGQEERNVEFLLNNGLAVITSKTYTVAEGIFQLFSRENRIKKLRENIIEIRKENAADNICKALIEETNRRKKRQQMLSK